MYFMDHFEMYSYPMFLFYLIWKYCIIWTLFSVCILRWDRISISFYSVFQDEILEEYRLALYFRIQMCMRMLWDLILRYSICWVFVFHHIQKYDTIRIGCQLYLKKRKADPRRCVYCLRKRRVDQRRCAYCLRRRRVDQRWCAYCLEKRRAVSRCRACPEGKRRAKRCVFDGCFLCRSRRIASGRVGIQKRRNGPISGATRRNQML